MSRIQWNLKAVARKQFLNHCVGRLSDPWEPLGWAGKQWRESRQVLEDSLYRRGRNKSQLLPGPLLQSVKISYTCYLKVWNFSATAPEKPGSSSQVPTI